MRNVYFLFCLFVFSVAVVSAADRPNIILIMADDMGYSDIGCYGSEIETPELDALAAGGLRFTQFYNTARCCPTRASLLTGLYPHQAGVGHMMSDRGYDGYRGDLNKHCLTIAQVMKTAGYATYMAGKWHVTKHTAADGPKHNWPRQRGFDHFYGTISGAGSFFDPWSLVRENTMISAYADPEYQTAQYYYTDAISDHAVRYIDEHKEREGDKPFFMYVAYTAAHWPMHALDRDIAKYKGWYDKGYDAIRAARWEKMKQLGVIDSSWELSPQVWQWGHIQEEAWEIRCMEVYAAMIDSMDQGIGRIVDSLERNGQFDNTVVMYFQDNGGCAEGYGRKARKEFPRRPDQAPFPPMKPEEIQGKMQPTIWRNGFPVVTGPEVMPGPADTYIAYGRGWANVSNTPFKEYKHWVHEGGISSPLIAHWPRGIKDSQGQLRHQPSHLIDMMATCVDLGEADYPEQFQGHAIKPMEGLSLVPTWEANRDLDRDAIYWEHEGNRAVRVGDYKLVAKGEKGAWELYDLKQDRTEMHNLATTMPELTEQLAAKWQAYAQRANVLPLNPKRKQ